MSELRNSHQDGTVSTAPAGAEPARTLRHPSVWLTGQTCSRDQRRARYLRVSHAHPAKMLPAIARQLITTYTQPGETVLDPMCGIGTTLVEAAHLGRTGIGVEYEHRWARLATANLAHAQNQGATGTGQVIQGDARHLPNLLPAQLHGHVTLVITSPPYGPSVHGHFDEQLRRHGIIEKVNNQYGHDRRNLAHADTGALASGFGQILTGCVPLLRPGGIVAVTARPYRHRGELVDMPGMVITAGQAAGLQLIDRCAALIAAIRHGRLVPRPSFFQLRNLRAARAAGTPLFLLQHEEVILFARQSGPAKRSSGASAGARRVGLR
jgi:tRNA G10  N-methylase Trm11